MFTLEVKKKGQVIAECAVSDEKELFVGRNEQNDIVLEASYGISRKHLKIFKDGLTWKVQCISTMGGLIANGKEVSKLELNPGDIFYLGDYSFHWSSASTSDEKATPQEEEINSPDSAFQEGDFSPDSPASDISASKSPSSPDNLEENINELIEEEGEEEKEGEEGAEKEEAEQEEASTEQNENNEVSDKEEEIPQDNPDEAEKSHPQMKTSSESKKKDTQTEPTMVTRIFDDLQPYLVISLSEDEEDQSIHLKGEKWTVGRDPSNDICIEETDISRRHFEITKRNGKFFIKDLDSANCTYLGDQWLDPKKEYPLESGTTIRILDIEVYFEVRNPRMEKKLNKLPASIPIQNSPSQPMTPYTAMPTPYSPPPSNVIADETILTAPPPAKSGKKRFFLIVAVFSLTVFALFFLLEKEKKKETDEEKESSSSLNANNPFDGLSPENKEQVKDFYSLAQQLYYQKKYELCYKKLNALHEIVPFYEQSKSLSTTCKNGTDSIQAQIEIERKRKQLKETKLLVAENIRECKNKLSSFESVDELQYCLSQSIEMDPENFEIVSLISDFEVKEALKKERRSQILAHKKRVNKEIKIYESAKKIQDDGKILKAIDAYKAFLKRKHPKGMEETVETAKAELQTMEEDLNSKIQTAMQSCTELVEDKKYKEAHKACRDVLNIYPNHQKASELANLAVKIINKELKPIYEESILNESLGQINIAKKHWKKILEQDIPNGNYYTKAQHKLNKY